MKEDQAMQPAEVRSARTSAGETSDRLFKPTVGETIVVIDFGSQYSQLIARRVRECKVYCEIVPYTTTWEHVQALNPKGFILSGGPASVYGERAPKAPDYVLSSGLPVLGICYGMQLLAHQLGGRVRPSDKREYGQAIIRRTEVSTPLFDDLPPNLPVWMSHGDMIAEMPPGFAALARTDSSPMAAMGRDGLIGLQFHPEVIHTPHGKTMISNFLYKICGCRGSWTTGSFITDTVGRLRDRIGNGQVICALSGGVDSAVTATLVHHAVGDQLTCIFVNNGLLRKGEPEQVLDTFRRNLNMKVVFAEASDRFLARLENIVDPEKKRKTIGEVFIRVFEEEARKLGEIDFLAQGTLYPDVIESAISESGAAVTIKSHHNVGGLPSNLSFSLVEPLRYLFKDEVRAVGAELDLPEEMLWRQPFPGPGLAVRIIGEVTRERLETLRAADWIVVNEMKKSGLYRQVWQSFAILTPLRSVGVMGDERTYENVVALRCVNSDDGMTADWSRIPYDVLSTISSRIVNEVRGVNRVVYDISSKPPSTIEWE